MRGIPKEMLDWKAQNSVERSGRKPSSEIRTWKMKKRKLQ